MAGKRGDAAAKAYGISRAEAEEIEVCAGFYCEGRKLKDVTPKQLRYMASRKTTMKQPTQYRRCVKAARVLAAGVELRWKKHISVGPQDCIAHCVDCSKAAVVARWRFDNKTRPTCADCGGSMEYDG